MQHPLQWTARIVEGKGSRAPFTAHVPGNLQKDYAEANGFPDVQFGDNTKYFEEIEDSAFLYETSIDVLPENSKRLFFICGGIDYQYEIALNGEVIDAYEGMYRKIALDLTDKLTGKNDTLTVKVYPHPKVPGAPQTRDQAAQSAKPPVSYGWDWNPRLLISGIWRSAYLEERDAGYIDNAKVKYTLHLEENYADVTFECKCRFKVTYTLRDAKGEIVFRGKDPSFRLENPHLWWCSEQGEPYLYTWEITSRSDKKTGTVGFRRVRLLLNRMEPNGFPKPRYDAPMTMELNGRKILCKGSNFVNPDIYWGTITKERYEELVLLARDAHMNIFRMWGGAGLQKDCFYDLCDRYGIMVWQEFMLACNNYEGTPHYLSVLEKEANACLDMLLPHPSLVLLCGGNELFNSWSMMTDQSHALRLLDKICYERCPEIPFNKTSPLTGMAHGSYVFWDERQGGDAFQEFQHASCTGYTEFGMPSISDVEELKKIIPENELFPPKPTPAWVNHHGFKAWGPERWVCTSVLERYFGKADSIEEMVAQSDWLQSEGYKGAFEEMRRQWPICSFMLNWDFNDPWIIAAGNSLIRYPAKPKPAYEAVKAALRPTLFSARIPKFDWRGGERFEAGIWFLNDAPEAKAGQVDVSLEIAGEQYFLFSWSAKADARSNAEGPSAVFTLPDVTADEITLRLSSPDGFRSDYRLRYTPSHAARVKRGLNGVEEV